MLGATVTHFTSLPFLGCRQNSQPDQIPRRASQKFISSTVNPKKSRSPQETQMMCSPQVCRCFLKSCLCCVKPSSACLLPPREFDPTPISLPFPPILFLILLSYSFIPRPSRPSSPFFLQIRLLHTSFPPILRCLARLIYPEPD